MTTSPWTVVFRRWLRDCPALDRIDYVDVPRWPGQHGSFEGSGPILTVTR